MNSFKCDLGSTAKYMAGKIYNYVIAFAFSVPCGGKQRIISPTLPELNLTAEQVFQAGGYPV